EPARPDGLLRGRRWQEGALPPEDADGLVLQRQRDPGHAPGHARPGSDRDPRVDLLRRRRRRPIGLGGPPMGARDAAGPASEPELEVVLNSRTVRADTSVGMNTDQVGSFRTRVADDGSLEVWG